MSGESDRLIPVTMDDESDNVVYVIVIGALSAVVIIQLILLIILYCMTSQRYQNKRAILVKNVSTQSDLEEDADIQAVHDEERFDLNITQNILNKKKRAKNVQKRVKTCRKRAKNVFVSYECV